MGNKSYPVNVRNPTIVTQKSENLLSFGKEEFQPIYDELLSQMSPSKDFKWYDAKNVFPNDICINIDNKYKIDYMQMQERLIEFQLDDKIMDAMIYLMMKERYSLVESLFTAGPKVPLIRRLRMAHGEG